MHRRGVFAAYSQHHEGRDNTADMPSYSESWRNEGHSSARPDESPPDLRNGFYRSELTLESMQRSYENRLKDANNHRLTSIVMSKIRENQDRSRYGQKALTLAEEMSGEDDDFVVMNTCQSVFDQVQQPVVIQHHHYHEKKKKRKHRSSSSSSSDESPETRKRRKEKKRKKKERKHKNASEQAVSSGDEDRNKAKKKVICSEFDQKRNPWKLLRKNEWGYKPFHMVIDTYGDPENAKYDYSHRGDVPDYRALNSEDSTFWRVFSELYKGLLSGPENSGVGKDQRMFSDRVMKQWGKCAPERTFRNRTNDKTFENYVKISHAPCALNEEGAISLCPMKHEMDQRMLNNINIDDFAHIMRSQNSSYEEANVQTRYSILQSLVLREPDNVDAWLKFVDIQREMQAKNESGDPNAPVQNTKALFEKMEEVIKRALDNKNVSSKNPRAVELYLKHLKILEGHFSPQSEAVVDSWARCENRFLNSIIMWRENIKMRQNDRAVFELKKMVLMDATSSGRLPLIDHCIKKLVEIKNGTIKTHPMIEGTEQFLVDLIVQRCRLQVVSGHIAKAVSVMQAMAEFHFFRPEVYKNFRPETKPHVIQQELKKGFRTFWCSGLPRIGEADANGWFRFDRDDLVNQMPQNNEAELLDQKWTTMNEEEKRLLALYKGHGLSPVEIRRRLEKFREKVRLWFWLPVHFKHDDEHLYEHKTRITNFEELEPLLFSFSDPKYAKDLIFKLLHIFGVPIPDVFIETQENILRQFSRSYFYSNSPISMGLNDFEKFIELFVTQIAESPLMDSPRIYTALITSISNSLLSNRKKYAALKQHVRVKIQGLKRCWNETRVSKEVQLSLYLTSFEEMVKIKSEHNSNCTEKDLITESAELDLCLALLHVNLDKKDRSLWTIGENETGDSERRKERLFFMRFVVFLARQLPFSTDPNEEVKKQRPVRIKKDGEIIGYLATKSEFLHSIFFNGRIEQAPDNAETKGTAYNYFRTRLSRPAALTLADPLRWIGDENELVFELCSYYAYEFPVEPKLRFGVFMKNDSVFYETSLGVLLKERPCVQETRIAILQHIVATSSNFTPGELREKLSQLVQRFPYNVPILKALLSVGSDFHKRRFLAQQPGTDDRSRLVRTCGRVFAAHMHFLSEHMRYTEQKYDKQALQTLIFQYVHLLRKAAEENCSDSLPDDYVWRFMMRHITKERNMLPRRVIDEVFTLGQGRCPWSKQFLMESLSGCYDRTDPFVTMINATMKTHGISMYCSDPEVQLLLESV